MSNLSSDGKSLAICGYEPAGTKRDIEFANMMNNLPKIVFSKTLEKAEWKNSRLVKENSAEEISKMK
jgi:hypothetical protein